MEQPSRCGLQLRHTAGLGQDTSTQRRPSVQHRVRPPSEVAVGQAAGRRAGGDLARDANGTRPLDPNLDAEPPGQLLAALRPRLALVRWVLAELAQLVVQQLVQHDLVGRLEQRRPGAEEPLVQVEPDAMPDLGHVADGTAVAGEPRALAVGCHRRQPDHRQDEARPHQAVAEQDRRGRDVLAQVAVQETVRVDVGAVGGAVVRSCVTQGAAHRPSPRLTAVMTNLEFNSEAAHNALWLCMPSQRRRAGRLARLADERRSTAAASPRAPHLGTRPGRTVRTAIRCTILAAEHLMVRPRGSGSRRHH
jgi:hypothetical protein